MPEDTNAANEPAPETDRLLERQTDPAPAWNCEAPTRSERGSGRTLPTVQAVDTTGDAANADRHEAHPTLLPPPIAADLGAPLVALCDLSDGIDTADTV